MSTQSGSDHAARRGEPGDAAVPGDEVHEPSPDDVVLQGHLEEVTVQVPHLSAQEERDTSAASVAMPRLEWAEPEPVSRGLGGSALSFSIAALCGSCFVGWLFPVAILAIVLGILAIRRPVENGRLGGWAIGLSLLSLVYSAGWIWWMGVRFGWW